MAMARSRTARSTLPPLKPDDAVGRVKMRLIGYTAGLDVRSPMMPLFLQLDPATRADDVVSREVDAMMIGHAVRFG